MARSFTAANSDYLEGSAPATAVPITMACRFNVPNITANHVLMMLLDGVGGVSRLQLQASGATGGDPLNAFLVTSAGSSVSAQSSTGFSANTWHSAMGVYASDTDRRVFLDGGGKGTNATARALTTPTILRLGANSTLGTFYTYLLAELAVWTAALSDEEAAAYGQGYSPLLIRPASLVSYVPTIGRVSPEPDIVGGFNLTLYGTPAVADHPRVIYPKRRGAGRLATAAAGGFNPAWAAGSNIVIQSNL